MRKKFFWADWERGHGVKLELWKKKKKRGETRYRHNIPLNKANEEVPPTIVVFARILSAGMEANKAREIIMENH